MLKKQTGLIQTFIFISFSYMLSGCFNAKSPQDTGLKPNCTAQGDCLIIRTANSKINFDTEKLTVESLISMTISSQKSIEAAWFTAINMDMGTIPIILNQNGESSDYQSQVFFGLCSEPKMLWQLTIKYTDATLEMVTLDVHWPNAGQSTKSL